eukprot:TRINITY_DN35761_c0_g1_i1.p2 TRINITY_DN35761_c0_g1~~TRINITY_DN35761_c0_g1_i1.p2  ORF type:complete len:185 (+),score=37.55 TRINITY_DN35761_c0_g1_i1:517-1071(+)
MSGCQALGQMAQFGALMSGGGQHEPTASPPPPKQTADPSISNTNALTKVLTELISKTNSGTGVQQSEATGGNVLGATGDAAISAVARLEARVGKLEIEFREHKEDLRTVVDRQKQDSMVLQRIETLLTRGTGEAGPPCLRADEPPKEPDAVDTMITQATHTAWSTKFSVGLQRAKMQFSAWPLA